MLTFNPKPSPVTNLVPPIGSTKNPVAGPTSFFSMAGERAHAFTNGVLRHPILTGIKDHLPAAPFGKLSAGLLGMSLLSGCAEVAASPLMIAQVAAGVSLLAGAGWLARSALSHNARQIVESRDQIKLLTDAEDQAVKPQELAQTVKTRPDVTIDILTGIEKEIIDKLASCSKTKIDWDSVIAVCEDILGEMRELGISSDQDAYRKIIELYAGAQTENQKLAEVAGDLIDQARRVPSWIEGQKFRVQQMRERQTREERLEELQRRVVGLVGKVDELKVQTAESIAETEQLTAEIMATQELLQRVDALTEVEAYLALPMMRDMPQETLSDLREKVAIKRGELLSAEGNNG